MEKDGVVLGDDRRLFFSKDLTVACRHYPVDLRSPPLLQEGEYPRTAVDTNPSFFAVAKKSTPSTEGEFATKFAIITNLL